MWTSMANVSTREATLSIDRETLSSKMEKYSSNTMRLIILLVGQMVNCLSLSSLKINAKRGKSELRMRLSITNE
jgi:hypothetical protein